MLSVFLFAGYDFLYCLLWIWLQSYTQHAWISHMLSFAEYYAFKYSSVQEKYKYLVCEVKSVSNLIKY
jgi:hypothetical protein